MATEYLVFAMFICFFAFTLGTAIWTMVYLSNLDRQITDLRQENYRLRGVSDLKKATFWYTCQDLFETRKIDGRWSKNSESLYKHYKNMPLFSGNQLNWLNKLMPLLNEVAKEHFDKTLPPLDMEINFDSEGNLITREQNAP